MSLLAATHYVALDSEPASSLTSPAGDFALQGSPPKITSQPQGALVCVGARVVFSVWAECANGVELTYQWQFNGQDLPGATNGTFEIIATSLAQAGNYRVVVSSCYGSLTSAEAALKVLPFAELPVGGRVWESALRDASYVGQPVIGPDGTIYIGWGNTLCALDGATGVQRWAASLRHPEDPPWVPMSFGSCTVAEDNTVYCTTTVLFCREPACVVRAVRLHAVDGATGIVRWQAKVDFHVPPCQAPMGWGSTGASAPSLGGDGTVYLGLSGGVRAYDGITGAMRWECALECNVTTPAIGRDGTIYVGSTDGAVHALRGASGSKRWEFTTGGEVNSSAAIGADGGVYISSNDGKLYALDGATGAKRWEAFAAGRPVIGMDGALYVASTNGNVLALAAATGAPLWESAVAYGTTPTALADGTLCMGSPDGLFHALDAATGVRRWSSEVSGGVASSIAIGSDSTAVFLTVNGTVVALKGSAPLAASSWPMEGQNPGRTSSVKPLEQPAVPIILGQPESQDVLAGATATLSVWVRGASPMQFQWEYSIPGWLDWTPIPGATNRSLTLPNFSEPGAYRLYIWNNGGEIYSAAADLGWVPLRITAQPQDVESLLGASAVLSVGAESAEGAQLTYQWQREGVDIPGATNATLELAAAQFNQAGRYGVVVSNRYGSAFSREAELKVVPARIGVAPLVVRICEGGSAVFHALAEGASGLVLTYHWEYEGQDISGATTATLNIPRAQLSQQGHYRPVVSTVHGEVTSGNARLEVVPLDEWLHVAAISPIDRGFSISVISAPGKTNCLEYTDSLNPAQWHRLPGVTGTGGIIQLQDTSPSNTSRFYRVVVP